MFNYFDCCCFGLILQKLIEKKTDKERERERKKKSAKETNDEYIVFVRTLKKSPQIDMTKA